MLLESLALAWLAGSSLVAQGGPLVLAPVAALLALRGRGRPRPSELFLLMLLLAAASIGGAHLYRLRAPSAGASDVSHFIGDGPTRLRGVVDGDRNELLHSVDLRMRLLQVEDDRGWHDASGVVLLRLSPSTVLQDGDLVEVRGRPRSPTTSGSFDYRAYLAQEGIYAEVDFPVTRRLGQGQGPRLQHLLVLARGRLDAGIRSLLPEPEASLGAGLVFGTSRIRDPGLAQALRTTNADMIAVATGFNVTLVGLAIRAGLAPLAGRRRAAMLGVLAMLVYAILVGFYPSVVRALIMTGLVLVASLVGRPYSAARLLLLACAGMTAVDPGSLTGASFPLSLSATGGVVWLLPPLQGTIHHHLRLGPDGSGRRSLVTALVDTSLVTLCAMIGAAPVVIAITHSFSFGSLPSNLLLFWLLPWLMAGAGAIAVVGAVNHSLALLVAPLGYVLLFLMVEVVRVCAALPGSNLPLPWFGKGAAVIVYGLTAAATWVWRSRETAGMRAVRSWLASQTAWLSRLRLAHATDWVRSAAMRPLPAGAASLRAGPSALLLACLPAVCLAAAVGVAAAAQRRLQVTYLDVGQGEAVLVQAGPQRILIDGGPAGEGTVRALDRTLPPWHRSLSLVIVTDRSAESVAGLPAVLQHYRVGAVLDATTAAPPAAAASADAAWIDWQRAVASTHITRLPRQPQMLISAGNGSIEVDAAASAGVLRLTPVATVVVRASGRSLLLSGDQTASLSTDVRGLARGNLTPPPSPPAVVLLPPAAAGNVPLSPLPAGFGHPLVYSTAANGDVTLTVTSGAVTARVQRGAPLGLIPPELGP